MLNKIYAHTSKFVLTSLIVFVLFGLAFSSMDARRKGQSKGDGTGRLSELKEKLNLSDDQITKLTPILKSHHNQVKVIREKYKDGSPDERQKMREEVKAIFDKTYTEAGSILSADQLTKFKEIIKQNNNPGGSKGKGQGKGKGYRGNN